MNKVKQRIINWVTDQASSGRCWSFAELNIFL